MVISLFLYVTVANFTFWWPLVAAQDNCFHPSELQYPEAIVAASLKFDLPFMLFVADERKKFVSSILMFSSLFFETFIFKDLNVSRLNLDWTLKLKA